MSESINPKEIAGAKKVPLQLLPTEPLREIAKVLECGAAKYGEYKWREVEIAASTYVGAIERHLFEWLDGSDQDEESGLHPLAHVAASCLIALDAMRVGKFVDNRPKLIDLEWQDD